MCIKCGGEVLYVLTGVGSINIGMVDLQAWGQIKEHQVCALIRLF